MTQEGQIKIQRGIVCLNGRLSVPGAEILATEKPGWGTLSFPSLKTQTAVKRPRPLLARWVLHIWHGEHEAVNHACCGGRSKSPFSRDGFDSFSKPTHAWKHYQKQTQCIQPHPRVWSPAKLTAVFRGSSSPFLTLKLSPPNCYWP